MELKDCSGLDQIKGFADLVPEIKAKVKIISAAMWEKSVSDDAPHNIEAEDFFGYHTILAEAYKGLSKMDALLNGSGRTKPI